ncbi:MAG: hypothetical protein ACRERD_18090 [Candidatus Binatia bacterium]
MNAKQSEPYLDAYARDIRDLLKYSAEDAIMIEHIMEKEILHTVAFDWLSARQFNSAARKAARVLEKDRAVYEEYFAGARAAFERMRETKDSSA